VQRLAQLDNLLLLLRVERPIGGGELPRERGGGGLLLLLGRDELLELARLGLALLLERQLLCTRGGRQRG